MRKYLADSIESKFYWRRFIAFLILFTSILIGVSIIMFAFMVLIHIMGGWVLIPIGLVLFALFAACID